MKARYILSAALALSLLPGCVKELESNSGKTTLRAVIEEETKVSFDGVEGRFSWNTGDQIAVYVGSAFQNATVEPTTGDFSIEETETELRNFYAVYPAAIAVADGAPTTLKVNLPASYDVSALAAAGDDEFSPVPMVAVNSNDQDLLYFRHVGGLLRVVCTNLPTSVKTITVIFDNDVTGEYTVNVSDPRNPRITNRGEGEGSNASTVTFTVSANGLPATNSFALNVPVPCGTYAKIEVKAYGNDMSNPVLQQEYSKASLTFARHHGKLLFFGETPGERTIGTLKDVTAYYFGGSFTFSDAFVSFKYDEYGDKEAAPFRFEYSATENGPWSDTAPDWIVPDPSIDFGGFSRPREMRISLQTQPNLAVDAHAEALKHATPKTDPFDLSTINVATGATVARTTANCYVVQAPGTYKFPLVYGNGVKDGAPNPSAYRARIGVNGDYRPANGKFDLKDTGNNRVAMGHLGYFKNHLYTIVGTEWETSDGNITNPYIEELLPANTTYTAQLIWTDAKGLIKEESVSITGSGQDAYITFEVPAETICQGNAMIALLADGKIAWSWHIWVTDEDLTALKDGLNGTKFAPVNIGWVGTKETERYETKQIYVRARQIETENVVSNTVLVTEEAGPTIVERGNSPFYQWGRKDPLPGTYLKQIDDQVGSERKQLYYSQSSNYMPKYSKEPWRPLGVVIQHPNIRYNYSGANVHGWNWTDKWIYNLWNTTYGDTLGETTFNEPVTKSVYDPSPVGFKVPNAIAYSNFEESSLPWTYAGQAAFNDGNNGRAYNNGQGVFLPESGYVLFDDSIHYNMSMYWSANLTNNTDNFRRAYVISFTETTLYPKDIVYLYNQLPVRSIQE